MSAIDDAVVSVDKYLHVSSGDVDSAFASGEEVSMSLDVFSLAYLTDLPKQIHVLCLRPVLYDEEFVRKLMGWVEDSRRGRRLQF